MQQAAPVECTNRLLAVVLRVTLQDAAEEDVGEEGEAEDAEIYATYRCAERSCIELEAASAAAAVVSAASAAAACW
jgi:hypothetical protein